MTEQTPRPIAAKDIRVGDTVRVSDEFEVVKRDGPGLIDRWGHAEHSYGTAYNRHWTLLSRPEPPREVGSRWVDPANGARYVLDEDDDYLRYERGSGDSGAVLYGNNRYDVRKIARLIALDGV